jgi:hypothetical protein
MLWLVTSSKMFSADAFESREERRRREQQQHRSRVFYGDHVSRLFDDSNEKTTFRRFEQKTLEILTKNSKFARFEKGATAPRQISDPSDCGTQKYSILSVICRQGDQIRRIFVDLATVFFEQFFF